MKERASDSFRWWLRCGTTTLVMSQFLIQLGRIQFKSLVVGPTYICNRADTKDYLVLT